MTNQSSQQADISMESNQSDDSMSGRQGGGDENEEAANEQALDNENASEFIKLKVVAQDGNEMHFRIKKRTAIKKLMNAYAQRLGLQVTTLRFLVDGRRIQPDDTPTGLEMEEDDIVEVFQEQTGGEMNH